MFETLARHDYQAVKQKTQYKMLVHLRRQRQEGSCHCTYEDNVKLVHLNPTSGSLRLHQDKAQCKTLMHLRRQ